MAVSARGQGTVELALGATLVVSTLLLGIYMSEVGYLSLKVQEAGNFAAFDGTGKRVHNFQTPMNGNNYQPFDGIGTDLSDAATKRYRDFDGTTPLGGPIQVTQVFTRADRMQVNCAQSGANGPEFPFPAGGGDSGDQLRRWYQNRGGITCAAQARLSALPSLPRHYLDGPGGFERKQLHDFVPMTVCGIGRAVSGSCKGRYSVLLGDWSLDGPLNTELSADFPFARDQTNTYPVYDDTTAYKSAVDEKNTNQLRNAPYRKMVRTLYLLSGETYAAGSGTPAASIQMADAMEPVRPALTREALYNERQPDRGIPNVGEDFAFSYAGPERGSQDVYETSCPPCHFNTNGTSTVDGPLGTRRLVVPQRWMDIRRDCFLGLDCN